MRRQLVIPVHSDDRGEQSRAARDHVGEDELESGVVGLCQDVERFRLASQFLEGKHSKKRSRFDNRVFPPKLGSILDDR